MYTNMVLRTLSAEWQSTYWNTARLSSLCCGHLIVFTAHLMLLVSITFAKTVLHRFRLTPGNWVHHHTSLATGNWVRHHMLSTSLCTCFIHKLRTKRFTFGFRFLLTFATERKIMQCEVSHFLCLGKATNHSRLLICGEESGVPVSLRFHH